MTDKTILEPGRALARRVGTTNPSHFRCFKTSPEIIRSAVMMYEPLLRNRYGATGKFLSVLSLASYVVFWRCVYRPKRAV